MILAQEADPAQVDLELLGHSITIAFGRLEPFLIPLATAILSVVVVGFFSDEKVQQLDGGDDSVCNEMLHLPGRLNNLVLWTADLCSTFAAGVATGITLPIHWEELDGATRAWMAALCVISFGAFSWVAG